MILIFKYIYAGYGEFSQGLSSYSQSIIIIYWTWSHFILSPMIELGTYILSFWENTNMVTASDFFVCSRLGSKYSNVYLTINRFRLNNYFVYTCLRWETITCRSKTKTVVRSSQICHIYYTFMFIMFNITNSKYVF